MHPLHSIIRSSIQLTHSPSPKVISLDHVFLPEGELYEVEAEEVKKDEKGDEALDEDKLLPQGFIAAPPRDRPQEGQVVQSRRCRGED